MNFKTALFSTLMMFPVIAGEELPSPIDAIVARAKKLELPTTYVPPPGNTLEHHTAGFAKTLCSAIFITGLDPDFAAENVGYFTGPYEARKQVIEKRIDRENKMVHLTLANGVVRTAKYLGDLGCVAFPLGEDAIHYTPTVLTSHLPDAATTPWPMGDVLLEEPFPEKLDLKKVSAAVNAAFDPKEGMTAAFVVTWKGRIIGEKYADGIGVHTPLESWSMGKSLTAALMGIMIQQGVYQLDQFAPIPEWKEGDPRAKIRISDLIHMSSGLRCRAHCDPGLDPNLGYLDHLYLYTGGVDTFHWAANLPQEWPPSSVGRYRNCDVVLLNYLIRLGVEGRGEEYHSFPRRALFDKIGIRNMIIEADSYGNFLLQGYVLGSGRDWARLGNLFLQDGIWNGERILPKGYRDFLTTVAPTWAADGRPIYGGLFWINGTGMLPIPKEAYCMAGAGGQFTIMIPSHDLVVVRLGHCKGESLGVESLKKALTLLIEAVPHHKK